MIENENETVCGKTQPKLEGEKYEKYTSRLWVYHFQSLDRTTAGQRRCEVPWLQDYFFSSASRTRENSPLCALASLRFCALGSLR